MSLSSAAADEASENTKLLEVRTATSVESIRQVLFFSVHLPRDYDSFFFSSLHNLYLLFPSDCFL